MNHTAFPKISLAIDNCFCSKRWTRPAEWMVLIRDMGVTLIEASADTECDPLYMGAAYMADWAGETERAAAELGVRIANLYSGHGTYATLGLTHTDERVRARIRDRWIKPQMALAARLGAGFGFFTHAIPDYAMRDSEIYAGYLNLLYDTLADIAVYAQEIGLSAVSVEQMYSPHQPPWTLSGADELLREVLQRSGTPMYLTLDTGHMNGQKNFQKTAEQDWLYAEPRDADHIAWLRRFACYSPIIHLQQNDGISSPHWPFSAAYNAKGIIRAEAVLAAIAESYAQPDTLPGLPRCEHILLTLEPFIGTAAVPGAALDEIAESVRYWRGFIPEDGMALDKIVGGII
ncbi:MAG: sugar phosphate isomerase/epimerase [Oscillospiraceae bacterium]|nr:sugar phosphate isomerase/epimerase [Oscillospiraceae bacterium]